MSMNNPFRSPAATTSPPEARRGKTSMSDYAPIYIGDLLGNCTGVMLHQF